MKCPYNSNSVTTNHAKPVQYKRLECETVDGAPEVLHWTNNDSTSTTVYHLHDCLKEECAAWQNDHCVRTA